MTDASARLAVPEDRDRVVQTVVHAFDQDPAFRYFFADPNEFADEATLFVGALFDVRVGLGSVWVSHECTVAALWVPPSGSPPADLSGLSAASRDRLDAYDRAVHHALPAEPHWYLGMLASAPHLRGQGLATRLSALGLEAARSHGVLAVLETTNADNVSLYRRAGWNVYRHLHDAPIPTWVMTR